jgi:hypothetical protein
MSDTKTEPISKKKTKQVSNRKAPPVAQGRQIDTSSSNSEIRTRKKKEIDEKPTKVGPTQRR